jgi:hypothetical protein
MGVSHALQVTRVTAYSGVVDLVVVDGLTLAGAPEMAGAVRGLATGTQTT